MKANLKIMKLMVEELLADPRRVKYLTEEEIAEIDLTTEVDIYAAYEEHCDYDARDWLWKDKNDIEIPDTVEEHRWYSVKYYARQLADGSWISFPYFFGMGDNSASDLDLDPLDYVSNLEVYEETQVVRVFKEID